MKKGHKALLITAGILLATGLVASASGLMMGASLRDVNMGITTDGWKWGNEGGTRTVPETPAAPDAPAAPVAPSMFSEEIRSLDISVGICEMIIVEGDTFAVETSGKDSKKVNVWVENGELNIETEEYRGGNFTITGDHLIIELTVPKDWRAREIDIEIGAGWLTADKLLANELSIDVGAGEASIGYVESTNTDITSGMGKIIIDGGVLTGKTDIECGMGTIDVVINGKEVDYGGSIEVGMGAVTIGSNSRAGTGGTINFNKGATNFIDAECGMGVINVLFEE